MKKLLSNTLSLTGLILVTQALVHMLMRHNWMYLPTALQVFLASAVIQVGLHLLDGLELRYPALNTLVNIGFILAVVLLFGLLFDWYSSTPAWLLVLSGVGLYAVGCLIDIMRLGRDIDYINRELARRAAKDDRERDATGR